jgi:hypothetical protein
VGCAVGALRTGRPLVIPFAALIPSMDLAAASLWLMKFMIANQRIIQMELERAQPGLVILPMQEALAENRLPDLF